MIRLGKCLIGVAATLVTVGGVAVASGDAERQNISQQPVATCGRYGVSAVINRKRVCLRERQRCVRRFARRYTRYGFACRGVLQVPWRTLYRPLRVLTLPPKKPCPTSPAKGNSAAIGQGVAVPLWGQGPAYPVLSEDQGRPVLNFRWPPALEMGPEWSGSKVLWFVDPRYGGRILVRGRQLDGDNELRFQDGRPAFTEAERLNPSHALRIEEGSRDQPAATRVRAAGCYAYQVDGRMFSYHIVFEARATS